jgi:hypothetical protein
MTRLIVAEVDKAVAVYGSRFFTLDDALSEPAPFTRMPLRWERSAGGPGTSNPVGLRLQARPDARGRMPVPNLQPPDAHVATRFDRLAPAGYGPVAPTWPDRLVKLHHHAPSWDHLRWSERPLPGDIDASYFNAAPPDQQTGEIPPEARVILENLHAEHPRLVTNLQAVVPRAVKDPGTGSAQELRLRCDTLSIDTDLGTVSLVWRGILPLDHPDQEGQVVVTASPVGVFSADPQHPSGEQDTVDSAAAPRVEGLPFRLGEISLAPPAAPAPPPEKSSLAETAPIHLHKVTPRAVLPFIRAEIAPPLAAPRLLDEPTETKILDLPVARADLPFRQGESTLAQAQAEPPSPRPSREDTATLPVAHLRARAALPFTGAARPPPPTWPEEEETATAPAPAPPPLISSLAMSEQRVPLPEAVPVPEAPITLGEAPRPPFSLREAPRPSFTKGEPQDHPAQPTTTGEPLPPPEPPPDPAEPELPLGAFPIERCAAIAASIGRRRAEKSATLARHDLAAEQWTRLDQHWADAIRQELERGRAGLLHMYDAAYVGQLEAERGPITVTEYARLVTAMDLGTEAEVLAELDLPRGAVLRVQRLWLDKLAGDPALGASVREAIERARAE